MVTKADLARPRPERGHPIGPLRRRLLLAAGGVAVFGLLHHLDHTVRCNHVGWPLQDMATRFTFSLVVYPLLLLGLWVTGRGGAGLR